MILDGKHPGFERRISGDDDFNEWNQLGLPKPGGPTRRAGDSPPLRSSERLTPAVGRKDIL